MPKRCSQIVGLVAAFMLLGETTPAADQLATLAVVARPDDSSRTFADLLGVKLSQDEGIKLVERDRIRAALAELNLGASGLVAATQRGRLGAIVAADIVLFVESDTKNKPAQIHVAAVETRTGLQLLDLLLPAANSERAASLAAAESHRVVGRTRSEDDSRLYLAFAGVRNEEPGEFLQPVARTLASLLRRDLQRTPRAFLLDRTRLRQLTAEQALTGIDLTLKTSALLVDAGIRRKPGGQGYDITLRVSSIDQRVTRTEQVEVASGDIQVVHKKTLAALAAMLDAPAPELNGLGPEQEAVVFANRARWFGSGRDVIEAINAAECAFALQPSTEHCRLLQRYLFLQARRHMDAIGRVPVKDVLQRRENYRGDLFEALRAAYRYHELDFWRLNQPDFEVRSIVNHNPFRPHVPRLHPDDPSREPPMAEALPEMQELRRDCDALRRKKLKRFVELVGSDLFVQGVLADRELEQADYFARDGADFVRRVLEIEKRLDDLIAKLKHRSTPRDEMLAEALRARRARTLAKQLKQTYGNRGSVARFHPQWPAAVLVPLWNALFEHHDPRVCAHGCLALCKLDMSRDRAVRRAVEVLPHVIEYSTDLCEQIRDHLGRTVELERVLEGIVAKAEADGHAVFLAERLRLLEALIFTIDDDQHDWHDRIAKLAARPVPDRTPKAHLVGGVSVLLKRFQKRPAPPNYPLGLKLHGAWKEYDVRFVMPRQSGQGSVASLIPLAHGTLGVGDADFLALSPGRQKTLDIGLLRLTNGGTVETIGKCHLDQLGQRGVLAAASGKRVFLTLNKPGLAWLDLASREVEEVNPDDGYLGAAIQSLAAVGGKLYYVGGGLCEFAPDTKQFRLLASPAATAENGPFDGPTNHHIQGLLADEQRACLWFTSNAASRRGVWKYLTTNRQFELVFDAAEAMSVSSPMWHQDGIVFRVQYQLTDQEVSKLLKKIPLRERQQLTAETFLTLRYSQRLLMLDPATNSVKELTGYTKTDLRKPFLLVGDHMVRHDGKLFTPDGVTHDLGIRWSALIPTSDGFVGFKGASSGMILHFFTRKTSAD